MIKSHEHYNTAYKTADERRVKWLDTQAEIHWKLFQGACVAVHLAKRQIEREGYTLVFVPNELLEETQRSYCLANSYDTDTYNDQWELQAKRMAQYIARHARK